MIEHPWQGFGAQRNVAIDDADRDWVLEIDADERVTPGLRAEIEAFLADAPAGVDICGCPAATCCMGGRLGPSAKYPKYRLRLFRRGAYRHDERLTVHEGLWAFGRTWAFEGDLEHVLADTLGEAIRDAGAYARLEAQQLSGPISAGAACAASSCDRPPSSATGCSWTAAGGTAGAASPRSRSTAAADALVWVLARGAGSAEPASSHYSQAARTERAGAAARDRQRLRQHHPRDAAG